MATFTINEINGDRCYIVSSNCIGCVRAAVLAKCPEDEKELWSNPELSMISIISYNWHHGDIACARARKSEI